MIWTIQNPVGGSANSAGEMLDPPMRIPNESQPTKGRNCWRSARCVVMSDAKFQPGVICDRCGHYCEGDYVLDIDFRRKYNGRDVCVSCLSMLKLENGDYSSEWTIAKIRHRNDANESRKSNVPLSRMRTGIPFWWNEGSPSRILQRKRDD